MSHVELVRSSTLTDRTPYADASVVPAGRTVFTAGACPLDEHGNVVFPDDVEGQARQVMHNLVEALRAAGAELTDVARTTVYVASRWREDLGTVRDVVVQAFGEHAVPSSLIGVSVLGYPEQMVEVEAVAVLPA